MFGKYDHQQFYECIRCASFTNQCVHDMDRQAIDCILILLEGKSSVSDLPSIFQETNNSGKQCNYVLMFCPKALCPLDPAFIPVSCRAVKCSSAFINAKAYFQHAAF